MHQEIPFPKLPPPAPATSGAAHTLALQSFSYQERRFIVPAVNDVLATSGCWLLERKPLSLTQLEFHFEVQLRAILELYAGLIAAGLELTRGSHLEMTALCTLRKFHPAPASLAGVVGVHLTIAFLEEQDLQSILTPAPSRA